MKYKNYYHLNRTICDVLEEMRKCNETRNYAPLLGLIEEAQMMANRMEAALADAKDIAKMNEEWHDLRDKVKKLRKERRLIDASAAAEENEDDE